MPNGEQVAKSFAELDISDGVIGLKSESAKPTTESKPVFTRADVDAKLVELKLPDTPENRKTARKALKAAKPVSEATTTTAGKPVIEVGEVVESSESAKPTTESKPVSEATTTAAGRPVIKVGEVVESKGEKVKKSGLRGTALGGKDKDDKTISDEIIDAALSSGSTKKKSEEEGEKDIDEKLQDKVSEKIEEELDPVGKVKAVVEKKAQKAKDELLDNLFEIDNEDMATKKAAGTLASDGSTAPATRAADTSRRIVDAGGKTDASTPAAKAILSADSGADGALSGMTAKRATKTLMDDAADVAKNVVKGMKNSKNLRLAATATLFSATGWGIGKATSRQPKAEENSVDEEESIRKQLMRDG